MWVILALLLLQTGGTTDPIRRAEAALASGRFSDAIAALDEASPGGRSAQWHYLRSKAYDALNDPARAVEHAEAALSLRPDVEDYHLQLAHIFMTRNTFVPALDIITAALERFPNSIMLRLGRGIVLKEMKRYEEAERELKVVLREKPDLGLAFDTLGTVYLNLARYEDLLKASEQFIQNAPTDYRGYFYLAAARDQLQMDERQTEEIVRRSIRIQPGFAAAQALLGKILLQQNKTNEAIQVLEKAVPLRPEYTATHLYLSQAYRKVGRMEDAERELKTLRELNDRKPPTPMLNYRKVPRAAAHQ